MKDKSLIAKERVEEELLEGEVLKWSGVPQQGLILRKFDLIEIPLSIIVCIIIFKLVAHAWAASEQLADVDPVLILFPLTMIPFLVGGVFMLIGRFIMDIVRRSNTYYGLTSQRVIIVSGFLRQKVQSLHVKTLLDISVTDHMLDRGTITLGEESGNSSLFLGSTFARSKNTRPRLERIENARGVYQQIIDAQDRYFLRQPSI